MGLPRPRFTIRAHLRASLNHLVGEQQQRLRNLQPKCLGGLQVDDQLELCGLLPASRSELGMRERKK
jgi:hypothetical protein